MTGIYAVTYLQYYEIHLYPYLDAFLIIKTNEIWIYDHSLIKWKKLRLTFVYCSSKVYVFEAAVMIAKCRHFIAILELFFLCAITQTAPVNLEKREISTSLSDETQNFYCTSHLLKNLVKFMVQVNTKNVQYIATCICTKVSCQ